MFFRKKKLYEPFTIDKAKKMTNDAQEARLHIREQDIKYSCQRGESFRIFEGYYHPGLNELEIKHFKKLGYTVTAFPAVYYRDYINGMPVKSSKIKTTNYKVSWK